MYPLNSNMEKLGSIFERYSGVPTRYKGIWFRSRLEAKWAVFCDCCNWQWVYEPFDLHGWLPDFQIGSQGLLVEIKPFTSQEEFEPVMEKIHGAFLNSGHWKDVLLLGVAPFWCEEYNMPQLGWLMDYSKWGENPPGQSIPEPYLTHAIWGRLWKTDRFTLGSMKDGWMDRVYGSEEKTCTPFWHSPEEAKELMEEFAAKAANETQWKPGNARS